MDKRILIGVAVCVALLATWFVFARYGQQWWQARQRGALPEAQTFEEVTSTLEEEVPFTFPLEREETETAVPVIANEREAIFVQEQDNAPLSSTGSGSMASLGTPETTNDVRRTTYDSVNLAVPFTSQAPHANWSLPYQEACEEASVLMAVDFFDDALVDLSTADGADEEILSLVAFQTERYGDYLDTTAAETARFASQKYEHILFSLLENPSVADLQSELLQGYLVIVPAYGRALGNPNFTGDGPLYHMLVLRGFDSERGIFITNDPGTRNGEAYVYREDVLMNAIGDWNDGDPEHGAKVVIVVAPRVR